MVLKAVLFDLGGTLADYFSRSEFPSILYQGITNVQSHLQQKGMLTVSSDTMWTRVREEDHEAEDYSVRPLEDRLARIFGLDSNRMDELLMDLCRAFMRPIFARGRCYEDSVPTLEELRSRGHRTGLISNTTWGSPAPLWKEEVKRLGLDGLLDLAVFCRDVGWRKPSPQIFECALDRLNVEAGDCIFVGDDLRWDVAGPERVGMRAVLLDRNGREVGVDAIHSLYQLSSFPLLKP